MATNRTTFPAIVETDDTGFPGYFNGMANYLSRQALLGRLYGETVNAQKQFILADTGSAVHRSVGVTTKPTAGFVSDVVLGNKSATTYVDTTNTTCLYTEGGLVAFCDVLDLFDDASVSATIWNTSLTSSGTVTESSGRLDLDAPSSSDAAYALSNGASGLDIHGANAEILMEIEYDLSTGGSTTSATLYIQISNGATHVSVYSVSLVNTSQGATGRGIVRVVYNHSGLTCDVFFTPFQSTYNSVGSPDYDYTSKLGEEVLVADNVDVSTVTTNKYLRLGVATGGNSAVAVMYVYGVGYRKNGAGAANADLVVDETLLSSTDIAIFETLWHTKPAANPSVVFSTNGTTTYGTDDCYAAWGEAPSSGTSMKARVRVAKATTITANQANIPILTAWGALHG